MNRELKLCLAVLLTAIALDALAELYFIAKRNNLTGEFAEYLRSKHGQFERYYAERARDAGTGGNRRSADGGGASQSAGHSMGGNAKLDNGNGEGGQDADGRNAGSRSANAGGGE